MNNQEAIKILGQYDVSNLHFYTTDGEEIPFTEWSDAIEMAISALKKQMPKKPKKIDHWRLCPICYEKNGFSYDYLVGMKQRGHEDISYCLGCGQKIDWEDE